jgi:hypothetical protein
MSFKGMNKGINFQRQEYSIEDDNTMCIFQSGRNKGDKNVIKDIRMKYV